MKCKVDGCGRDIMYKAKQLCQKHYFRQMRYGTTELTSTRKYRIQSPAGYQKLYEPQHILADSCGYVYEHRFLMYEIYKESLPDCILCGRSLNWDNAYIDHIDNDPTNNKIENIRPLCNGCNTFRAKRIYHTHKRRHSITCKGISMTPAEWSRQPNVNISGNTILFRLAKGMTEEEAIYSPRKTHKNSTNPKKYIPKFKYGTSELQ